MGTQTFRAAESEAGSRVELSLEYKLTKYGPLGGAGGRDLHPPRAARLAAPHALAASRWRRRRRPGSGSLRRRHRRRSSVRLQSRRRGGRDHGRGDRPGHRLRRHPGRPQGREAGVRRRRASTKAREVTQGQLGGLVAKEKITQEDADRQLEEIARPHHGRHRLRGLRRRGLRDRGRARADGDQAGGLRRARRGHARPRDPRLQHLVAVHHRDGARPRSARTRSAASTSSTPPR